MTNKIIIEKTINWIKQFIISYNICPFAYQSFDQDLIKYRVDDSPDFEPGLFAFTIFIRELSFNLDSFSNAFLIFPFWKGDFENFLDFMEYGYVILDEMNIGDLFQLVAFHPEFHYQDESKDDITNATNQSPFPMIHILKIEDVAKAIKSHPDAEQIAHANKEKLGLFSKKEQIKLKSLKKL